MKNVSPFGLSAVTSHAWPSIFIADTGIRARLGVESAAGAPV